MVDDEFNAKAVETLKAAHVLIMAASGLPRPDNDPTVKEQMNGRPKLVFSKTLKRVGWQNSRLATGSIAEEVARLKQVPGDG